MSLDWEFQIVGGKLKMQKKIFILEMLSKDSRLRTLLKWKTARDFAEEHPAVSKPDAEGVITIDFSYIADIVLGQSWEELLGELKLKYKEQIKGRVACRGNYWGILTSFEIDLNSDGDKIEYIKG